MVRHRIHLVATLGRYRDAINWLTDLNAERRRIGVPEFTAWAPIQGDFNSLILEAEYEDLAAYDAANHKFHHDPQTMTVFRRGNEWGSTSHWPKDEILASAGQIA